MDTMGTRRSRKKWRILLPLTVVTGALLSLLLWAAIRPEPKYEGRPISEWIEGFAGMINPNAGAVLAPTLPKLIEADPGADILPPLRSVAMRGTRPRDAAYRELYEWLPDSLVNELNVAPPNPTRDEQLRYRALLILYYLEDESRKTRRLFVRVCSKDPYPEARRLATSALERWSAHDRAAIDALLVASTDAAPSVRQAAIKALGSAEPDDEILHALASRLSDTSIPVRRTAARTIGGFAGDAAPIIASLVSALESSDRDVVSYSAQALGKMGAVAESAAPALESALERQIPHTETALKWALRRVRQSEK